MRRQSLPAVVFAGPPESGSGLRGTGALAIATLEVQTRPNALELAVCPRK